MRLAGSSAPLNRSLLQSRGGFAWWYLDLVNEDGDGLVLIWSFGLPFLPGYAQAAREGAPQLASQRPSLNVVVYEGGREQLYLLQEYAPEQAEWIEGTERCRFGDSWLESRWEGSERCVQVQLDCPLPGTTDRLTGSIRARGLGSVVPDSASDQSHSWTPLLAAGEGVARLSVGGQAREVLRGRVYHDRNGSTQALHELGIERWIWARVAAPGRELVAYLVWPEGGGEPTCHGLELHSDGRVQVHRSVEVVELKSRRGLYGMRGWRRLSLAVDGAPWLTLAPTHHVEDGPFYLRDMVSASTPDEQGLVGVAEVVSPHRVDLDLHRPMVRQRVHHVEGENPWMVPWFTGDREGRWGRILLSTLTGRAA